MRATHHISNLLYHPRSWGQSIIRFYLNSQHQKPNNFPKPPMTTGAIGTKHSSVNSYIQECGSVLKICGTKNCARQGKLVHGFAIKMGLSEDRFIGIKLLIMYVKCGKIEDAKAIFMELDGFDVVAWNCMVSAQAQLGNFGEARQLFDEMPERNAVSWTCLITGLVKFGKVDDAKECFESNPFKNVVSWTAMVSGYVQNGLHTEALRLFVRMLECGVSPNQVTFVSVLRGCVGLSRFRLGKTVLCLIVKLGFESDLSVCNSLITLHVRMGDIDLARRVFNEMVEKDVVSWTAILDLYVEMGDLREARRLFDEMPERNDVSWSAMIARYNQNGDGEEALKLFYKMVYDGIKPNISCFASVISACANLGALQLGMNIHGLVVKSGNEANVFIGSPLIDMYCKCAKSGDGRRVFDMIPEKNTVSFNSMVAGYSYNDQLDEAVELFGQIPKKNIVSWNSIIAGYVQNEHCEKALEVFDFMQSMGELPNQSTFSSILRACASLASLEKGKNLHGKAIKLGIQYGVFMGTALTDMYAKSGDIISSKQVFDRMPERNEISWTAMIQGLADNGLAEESLILFEEMEREKVIPTELTYLGVLFACAHRRLVDKGIYHFKSMENVYNIKPRGRHYTCIVDLLARAGLLREAEEFIRTMPFQPEANAWAALLSACNTYRNEEIGERTARKLWELERENSAGYVLLSNIYASAGRWNDVSRVRRLMREEGLKKCAGCSWIEVKNEVHSFYIDDKCHPQSEDLWNTGFANLRDDCTETLASHRCGEPDIHDFLME